LPAASSYAQLLNGPGLGLAWGIPFLGLLLTIALAQTLWPAGWSRHYGKLTSLWIAAAVVPLIVHFGNAGATALETLLLLDYLPFVVSIAALYIIAGGIHIRSRMSGHPGENAILFALGTLAGGIIGTPGATLLFLPVLLKANRWRRYRAHSLIFLILLICNIGGAFSPMGPPLLIGYLRGVSFLWTVRAMAPPTLFVSGLLIAIYLTLDSLLLYRREDSAARARHKQVHNALGLEGRVNLLLLAGAIILQIACGQWQSPLSINLGVTPLPLPDIVRLLALAALAMASLALTPRRVRMANHFAWEPIAEVAIVFAGIFACILPLLAILEAGPNGAMAGLLHLVTGPDGQPINWAYFTATGLLSGFLDNAPTFLLFFNAAGGDPTALMGPQAITLMAISAGAAFWGGLTYVGNAPNLMVRSIAEQQGIRMPSFLTYMVYAAIVLLPVFALTAFLFFA
jgi:Na+/H+ antiporter NhaD/arsenite permease-like protein